MRFDPEALRALVREHRGNLTAIAAVLGVTRQAVTGRLERSGLSALAAKARSRAANVGPRSHMSPAAVEQERRRLIGALARHGSYAATARKLGWSARTVARRARSLKIGARDVELERAALQPHLPC